MKQLRITPPVICILKVYDKLRLESDTSKTEQQLEKHCFIFNKDIGYSLFVTQRNYYKQDKITVLQSYK